MQDVFTGIKNKYKSSQKKAKQDNVDSIAYKEKARKQISFLLLLTLQKGKESFEMGPENVYFILLQVFLSQKLCKGQGGYEQRHVCIGDFVRITVGDRMKGLN